MNNIIQDRFEGCLLGLALGDALGAPLEGGPLERFVWRLIGTTRNGKMRFSDDTQMSLDLAECLLAKGDIEPDDLAARFAKSYRWSRGYGPGAARLLKRIARGAHWSDVNCSVFPDGSFGNGGAMRAPIIGLYYHARLDACTEAARTSARITHAHPLGIEGAVLIAAATAKAVTSTDPAQILHAASNACVLPPFTKRLTLAKTWLDSAQSPNAKEVRKQLGNGIAAAQSCVTAVYIAARFMHDSFLDAQAFVAACGGDVDTIGAMAGAIWGAANGASSLPPDSLSKLEQRDWLRTVACSLHKKSD